MRFSSGRVVEYKQKPKQVTLVKQESLFTQPLHTPLADRVRPRNLREFVGQEHLVGPGKILRDLIDRDQLSSMIFWGPPGVGKTTLAKIIAQKTKAEFVTYSAVTSSIKDIKALMKQAEANRDYGQRTVVFVDEFHRFNKAQQDAFLPYVENGAIILIGATTENPSFEINAALLSRCRVFVLKELQVKDIQKLLHQALERGFTYPVVITDEMVDQIATFANGDARVALNTLEMVVENSDRQADGKVVVASDLLDQLLAGKAIRYDKNGEEHYNLISALHKAMRNSDADAAVYWLNRMLAGGEDPLYIARRLVRFASEDIGLADPNALNLAINVYQACQFIGMPECNVHLTEAAIYLSLAPKSNAVYRAVMDVQADIKKTQNLPVPLHIRNAPTKLMKDLHYGKGYQYAHDTKDKITSMQTMPDQLVGHHYYKPTTQGMEAQVKQRFEAIKRWHQQHDPH